MNVNGGGTGTGNGVWSWVMVVDRPRFIGHDQKGNLGEGRYSRYVLSFRRRRQAKRFFFTIPCREPFFFFLSLNFRILYIGGG